MLVGVSKGGSSYLDVLQVDLDQADALGLGQQLDAADAGELGERGHDAELVVHHLAHAVARPHQQAHRGLPVLELQGGAGCRDQGGDGFKRMLIQNALRAWT